MIFLETFTRERFKYLLVEFKFKLKEYCKEAYPPEYQTNFRGQTMALTSSFQN